MLTLSLPRPHNGQWHVKQSPARFKCLACGRRWGKSTLIVDRIADVTLHGYPYGYFAPTYKLLLEVWRAAFDALRPAIKRANATERRIELVTGGVAEFWTLEDPDAGRSRKYKEVAVDEAGLVTNLLEIWRSAIRPTLTDYAGGGIIAGTPKGHNDFEELFSLGLGSAAEWASFRKPTEDNPHIRPEEVRALRDELGPRLAAQELDAEFVDAADVDRFLPDMAWWDACQEELPSLGPREPLVLGVDAGLSSDVFACVGVTPHPTDKTRLAQRLVKAWVPAERKPLDYDEIETALGNIISQYNVICVAYDPFLLAHMMGRLGQRVWCEPFGQSGPRLEADKALLDRIASRGIAQNGDSLLRAHIANADRKMDGETRRLRIVKRRPDLKIDLAVALSMGAAMAGSLNL